MIRAPLVAVTCPKVTELKFVETLEYCVWFSAFCRSALNSIVRSPTEKFFPRERFRLEYPDSASIAHVAPPRSAAGSRNDGQLHKSRPIQILQVAKAAARLVHCPFDIDQIRDVHRFA